MNLPAIPSPAIQLQLVPGTVLPVGANTQLATATSRQFTSLLGSLIEPETSVPAAVTPKKQASAPDTTTTALITATTAPPTPPVILPSVLKLHFSFTPSAPSESTDDETTSEPAGENTAPNASSATPSIAAVPVPVIVPAPTAPATPHLQTAPPAVSTAKPQPTAARQTSLKQPASNAAQAQAAIAVPVPLPAPAPPPAPTPTQSSNTPVSAPEISHLTVKSDPAAAPIQTELAFSAKLAPRQDTPTVLATLISANQPNFTPPKPPATPTKPTTATTQAPPQSAVQPQAANSQQADADVNSDTNSDTSQSAKPPAKPAPKPTAEAAPESFKPAEPTSAPVAPQASSAIPAAAAIQLAAAPNTAPNTSKQSPEPPSQPADARPVAAAIPDVRTAPSSEPVRDLSIRIGDTPGNQVDVKIQERAGEVHVAVLSSSPTLTSDLRQQVGDLVGKLDRAGYHTETFKPTSSNASNPSSSQPDSSQQQENSGSQQQDQQAARQQLLARQKKSTQTQWLQQMNGSFGVANVEGIE